MTGLWNLRRGAAALALSAACLGGCEHTPRTATGPAIPPPAPSEPTARVGPHQAAGVKAEYGHMLERRGDSAGAMSAYLDAHKQDQSNLDALLGIARLLDLQGRFAESMDYYRQAEKSTPGNTRVACNYGFSLYLQGRYGEAEAALRQALARQPDNNKAHTNLGLVLARSGRPAEALTEFRRAGCEGADAHMNVAFALTLQKSLPEARAEYEKALALDPSSAAAKKDLRDLEMVMAKNAEAPAGKAEAAE
jgi:Tfp pilus assembly protein PilF